MAACLSSNSKASYRDNSSHGASPQALRKKRWTSDNPNFRENRSNVSIFVKNFRENSINFFLKQLIFYSCHAHLLLSYLYFRKNFRENEYFHENFDENFNHVARKMAESNMFAKICQNLNIFTTMVPFSHVANELCFYCNKVKEKSTLANFRNIFYIYNFSSNFCKVDEIQPSI